MATLTTYTQALQHIDTQDILDYEYTHLPATKHLNPFSELFLRIEVAEWQFKADDATHVYRIQYPEGNDLFGTLVYAEYMRDVEPATVAVSLRLLPDTAAEIVKAVLAETDTQDAKPQGDSHTIKDLQAARDDLTRITTKARDPYTMWNGMPISFPVPPYWHVQPVTSVWREGEGNNP